MNTLHCSVDTCQHYCNNLCNLNSINVDGPTGRSSTQTFCSSFDHKQMSAQNSNSQGSAAPTTKIRCEVTNCIYNKSYDCSADTVQVSYSEPGTSTATGTLCGTFRER